MKNHTRFIIAAIILFICNLFIYKHIFNSSCETKAINNEFPFRISDWTAEEVVYDKEVLSVLSPDKIIFRNYRNGNMDPPITLFIAYYSTLEKSDLSHSPIVCFTGQGWQIESITKKEIPVNLLGNTKIKVNQMIQSKLDTTMITLFWYQSARNASANRGIQKISLFFDKLFGKSDHNAFVSINIIVPQGKPVNEISSYLHAFVYDLYPELKRFFL